MKIAIIHPDLGIGGAERLIVDVAVGLQKLDHSVDVYTSFHDPSHSFSETVDGTLSVTTLGGSIVPRSMFNKFHLLCAILRQTHLIWILCINRREYDVVLMDQLSSGIPLVRALLGVRVVFYCHFPDKLLANATAADVDDDGNVLSTFKPDLIRRLYRFPLNWFEEYTTGKADKILANSRFTAKVFASSFPNIEALPEVIYPAINEVSYANLTPQELESSELMSIKSPIPTFLSLNRFEAKKNLELAVEAFANLNRKDLRLILAGGCDRKLESQVSVLHGLHELCRRLDIQFTTVEGKAVASVDFKEEIKSSRVLFLLNYTEIQRSYLLQAESTKLLLYTPTNEHFGIVPLEAMISSLPVLCTRSGGPRESVVEGETGFLRPPDPNAWSQVLSHVLSMSKSERSTMGANGKKRVLELFSSSHMASEFSRVLQAECEKSRPAKFTAGASVLAVAFTVAAIFLLYWPSIINFVSCRD